MMYEYMTLADNTLITHSQILEKSGEQVVQVHFERPIENGFCSARAELPSYNWIYNEGFTENEITEFTRLMERHAHLFYKYALEEGGCILASNAGHIPQKDLNKIEDIIAAEFFIICAKWKTFFNTDTIRFYC